MVTTNVGDYLAVWITGYVRTYIAEVIQSEPLVAKVSEVGCFSGLQVGDFILLEQETEQLQEDCRNGTCIFLTQEFRSGRKTVSGLRSLGIKDDRLWEILPPGNL